MFILDNIKLSFGSFYLLRKIFLETLHLSAEVDLIDLRGFEHPFYQHKKENTKLAILALAQSLLWYKNKCYFLPRTNKLTHTAVRSTKHKNGRGQFFGSKCIRL